MQGFMRMLLGPEGAELYESNDLFRTEVQRVFTRHITGNAPTNDGFGLYADLLFKGSHRLDTERHLFGRLNYYSQITAGLGMSETGEVMRYRRRASLTDLASPPPGQIAYALGRICAANNNNFQGAPQGVISQVDVDLGTIGSVFGHPAASRALHTETGVDPVGVGDLLNGGTLSQPEGEKGHYHYYVRIAETGNDIGATYWWQRRPYVAGSYEAGTNDADNYKPSGFSLANRLFTSSTRGCVYLNQNAVNMVTPSDSTPSPVSVPYDIEYPTTAGIAISDSFTSGLCFDGHSRIWWTVCNSDINNDVNGIISRSLWGWKRYTGEAANRFDAAAGAGGDMAMQGWPSLHAHAQLRDCKAGRGGFIWVAADGTNDTQPGDGTAEQGALIQIDTNPITGTGDDLGTPASGQQQLDDAGASFPTNVVNLFIEITGAANAANNGIFKILARDSGTRLQIDNPDGVQELAGSFTYTILESVVGVKDVWGTAVAGIYTAAGVLSNDILAITVDQTESYALAGEDRVWVLHRNGLSYADFSTTTGDIDATGWQTVRDAGGDFNPLEADSVRGLGGFAPVGNSGRQNEHGALLDHDGNGDIYFVTTQTGGSHQTGGPNRLNRLIGNASAHTFYTLDTVAEAGPPAGSQGFLEMGTHIATEDSVIRLKVHRRDPGDPADDDIWVSTGQGNNSSTSRNVQQIPIGDWGGGDNPGIGYFGDTMSAATTGIPWFVQVAPDGTVWVVSRNNNYVALLESLGRELREVTESINITGTPPNMTINSTSSFFTPSDDNKRLVIEGSSNSNDGSFKLTYVSATQVTCTISGSAGAETNNMTLRLAGIDFDSRSGDESSPTAPGGWTNTVVNNAGAPEWFPDDSGVAFIWPGRTATQENVQFLLGLHGAQTYLWDSVGSQWYRSRVPHPEAPVTDGEVRTAHTTQEALRNGVTIAFANTGAGGDEFVAGDYYTFPVSIGKIKTATEEITFGYDLFSEKTELFNRGSEIDMTASLQTARCGVIYAGSLAGVGTDNPFWDGAASDLPAELDGQKMAMYQRRLTFDGTDNTTLLRTNGTHSTTDGTQIGLDVGSDLVATVLRFCVSDFPTAVAGDLQIDLYSALAADLGGTPPNETIAWGSPRATYRSDQDAPEWNVSGDAFHNAVNSLYSTINNGTEIEIDLAALETNAVLANPATNDAMRFWKIVIYRHTGSASSQYEMVGAMALDNGNPKLPLGISTSHYLSTAHDVNYLANLIIRAVFVQDDAATAGGNCDGTGTSITLLAGTFAADIAQNDFFRQLDSNGDVVQEVLIDSRDTGTALTLQSALPTNFTNEDWEVVRNADIRPRDDEGGNEDVAQFPDPGVGGAGQVFICPVTGHIFYNDDDVSNSRTFRVERYVKVKRSL